LIHPLLPWPVLAIEDEKTLVVTDLHLGYEHSLVDKGIYIPSQTFKIQNRLLQVVGDYRPRSLIILGDVKQAIPRISLEEWKDVPDFFEAIGAAVRVIQVIPGNHDGDLEPLTPPSVKILSANGVVIGGKLRVGLFHGHAWPSPEVLSSDIMVMGHIHPVVRFRT
jgi:putative SbcD/Mre11-related phosphoesterase